MPDYSVPAPDDNPKGYAVPAPDDVDHPKYPDWYTRSRDLKAKGYSANNPDEYFVNSRDLKAKGYSTDQGNPDIPILKKYGFRDDEIARLTKDPTYAPGAFQELEDLFGKGSRGGEAQATKVGRLSQGLTNLAMGGAQIGARLNPGRLFGVGQQPETTDAIARIKAAQIQANRNPEDTSILGVDPLEAAGQMLVPIPGGGAAKGAGLLKALARGATTGAAAAALQPENNVQYDASGESDFASRKAKGMAAGSALGVGGALVGRGVGRLLAKRVPSPPVGDVNTLGSDIAQKMEAASAQDVAALEKIANGGGARARAAQDLIDEIKATGNDPTRQLQLSARTKLLTEKIANDEAFAARDAAMKGVKDVPVARTINAINNTIADLERNPYPGQESAIKELKAFRDNLLPKTRDVMNGLVDETGQPMVEKVTTKPNLDFEALSAARATLKDKIRALYKGDVTGGSARNNMSSSQYQQIADALSEDLSNAAAKVPGASEADAAANALYRAYKQKWSRNSVNRNLIESQTPDEILKTFAGGAAKADRAANASAAMTQTGVESAKAQMLQSALDASGGDPAKFTTEIKKLQEALGVFFEGEDLQRLEGLKKIMRVSSRTGKALASGGGAALGSTVGPTGAVLGAALGPKIGLAGHVPAEDISRVVKRLFMTKAGQKILLEARRYEPRSPQWERAIREGEAALSRTGGIVGGENRPMEEENQ